MPGWLKALLIVAVVLVLLAVGVVGFGVYWWMHNKDALLARGKEVMTEAREFGKNTDNKGCVDESILRYKKDPGIRSTISNSIFMNACLENSRPTAGFCDDVPKETEFVKSAQWRVSKCEQVDLSSDHYCQNLFQPVQQFCQRKARRSNDNDNSDSQ